MKLREYLVKYNVTVVALSKETGISRQAIHAYLENATPSLKRAFLIDHATSGKVTYDDWVKNEWITKVSTRSRLHKPSRLMNELI